MWRPKAAAQRWLPWPPAQCRSKACSKLVLQRQRTSGGAYQCNRGLAGGRADGQGRARQGLPGGGTGWGIGRAVAEISYSKVRCNPGSSEVSR